MKYYVRVGNEEVELTLHGDELTAEGGTVQASLTDVPGTPVRVLRIGEAVHRVLVQPGPARGSYVLSVDGRRHEVEAVDERTRTIRELAAAASPATGSAPLVAPMPGMIVRVHVSAGDVVSAGQGLVVMEAMKMENELRAPASATVKAVHVQPGVAVEKGALLLELG